MDKIDLTFQKNPKETAYFLGFFWADGTINREKYLLIEIVENDANALEDIFKKVADFKISKRTREKRRPQITFFIRDDEGSETLRSLGKYPGTFENHNKILNFIPDAYKIYFLRGLIDGDGCFYSGKINKKWKNNTIQFSISSRYEQDWSGLLEYFQKLGFSPKVVKRIQKNGNKSSIIRLSKFSVIEKFVNVLYSVNDGIYLTRKYEKIKDALIEHKAHKKESENRRKKFEITFENGEKILTNNLKAFADENKFCYECLSRAARKNKKYKNMTIRIVV